MDGDADEARKGSQDVPERTSPVFFRGKLGEKLHQETPGFDLSDPNMRVIDVSYNCLHDKHLKWFFRHPERKKRLVKKGLITSNEKVLCTRKEYNHYSSYIKSVQLLWEKQCCAQQKMLLKQFLVLQQQGEVPSHISLTDIREWLIAKGRNYFKKTFQSEMKEGKNLYLAELAWDVKRRLRLEELEREVCRELHLERRIPWSLIGQPGSQMGDWRPLGMETHTPLGMDSPSRHSTSSMDTLSSQILTENLQVARLHTARPHTARPQTTRPRTARPPTERPSSGSDHSGTLSTVMTCSPHSTSPSVITVRDLLLMIGHIKSSLLEEVNSNLIPAMVDFIRQRASESAAESVLPISKDTNEDSTQGSVSCTSLLSKVNIIYFTQSPDSRSSSISIDEPVTAVQTYCSSSSLSSEERAHSSSSQISTENLLAARPQYTRPQTDRPQSVRPQSVRPQSVRPQSARPQSARPQSARPQSARPQSARPQSARPQSARPQSAKPRTATDYSGTSSAVVGRGHVVPVKLTLDPFSSLLSSEETNTNLPSSSPSSCSIKLSDSRSDIPCSLALSSISNVSGCDSSSSTSLSSEEQAHSASNQISTNNLQAARPCSATPQSAMSQSGRPQSDRQCTATDDSETSSAVVGCTPHSASPYVIGPFSHGHVIPFKQTLASFSSSYNTSFPSSQGSSSSSSLVSTTLKLSATDMPPKQGSARSTSASSSCSIKLLDSMSDIPCSLAVRSISTVPGPDSSSSPVREHQFATEVSSICLSLDKNVQGGSVTPPDSSDVSLPSIIERAGVLVCSVISQSLAIVEAQSSVNVEEGSPSPTTVSHSPTRVFVSHLRSSPLGEDLVDSTLGNVIAVLKMEGILSSSPTFEEELLDLSSSCSSSSSETLRCVSVGPLGSGSETSFKLLGGRTLSIATPTAHVITEDLEVYSDEIIDEILIIMRTKKEDDSGSDLSGASTPCNTSESRSSSALRGVLPCDRRILSATLLGIQNTLDSVNLSGECSISPQDNARVLEMIELLQRRLEGTSSESSIHITDVASPQGFPLPVSLRAVQSCVVASDKDLKAERVKGVFESLRSQFMSNSIKPVSNIIAKATTKMAASNQVSLETLQAASAKSSAVAQNLISSVIFKVAKESCSDDLECLGDQLRCPSALARVLTLLTSEKATLTPDVLKIRREMSKEVATELQSFLIKGSLTGTQTPSNGHVCTSGSDPREAVRDILRKTKEEASNKSLDKIFSVNLDERLTDSIADALYPKLHDTLESKRELHASYYSSQISCSLSPFEVENSLELQEFSDPLSESILCLLDRTFGDKALNLKTGGGVFQYVTDSTYKKLLIGPHTNDVNVVVHTIAVEELPVEGCIAQSEAIHGLHKKQELPSNTSGRGNETPSPTNCLLEGVVGKLVQKMLFQGLDIPEVPMNDSRSETFKLQYELVAKLCPLMVRTIMATTIANQPPTIQEAVMSSENIHVKQLCEAAFKPLKENHVPDVSETNIMVRRALSEIESCMIETSEEDSPSLHSTPEVVVDLITKLLHGYELDPEDFASPVSSPTTPLSDVAMDMVVSVLRDMSDSPDVTSALEMTKDLKMPYSRLSSARIVSALCRELEEHMGSPDALRRALSHGSGEMTTAIASALTREVNHLGSIFPKVSVRPLSSDICLRTHQDKVMVKSRCGSAEVKTSQPVYIIVHVEAVMDIIVRLLSLIVPRNQVKLSGWTLVEDVTNKLSSALWVRVTNRWSEANVCLKATDIFQLVLAVHRKLTQRYGTEEALQKILCHKAPKLHKDIVCLVTNGIMEAPSKLQGTKNLESTLNLKELTALFNEMTTRQSLNKNAEQSSIKTVIEQPERSTVEQVTSGSTSFIRERLLEQVLMKLVKKICRMPKRTKKHQCIQISDMVTELIRLFDDEVAKYLIENMESQQTSLDSKMTSKLADAIYTDLGKVKRLKRYLKIEDFFEDQEMLSIVSVIVSHKLLAILKPSVPNPYDGEASDLEDSCSDSCSWDDVEEAESEGVHYATGRKSNVSIALRDTTEQPEVYIAVDSPPVIKLSKMRKGIQGFFWGVQKAWKRLVTCDSSGTSEG
ncbi:serine-rich adhesin for platelets isoform X1 [Coregonus clupeaformis]|uniref:serine-rich adhesin for platelets isoform X1 n=1 Tax=Coregonus clupeaformis TaxID=59861 RepID=UPI001E1C3A2E|nr:serine-rich adhesin for platelets isoform X1 [Coregonus clupeaformis]